MTTYKSPLTIYVVWHPNSRKGGLYADALYKTFCRDTDSPLTRALGIPVLFRFSALQNINVPAGIDTTESDRNAIVLLIDEEMFSDVNWFEYVQKLLDKEDGTSVRLYPVALSNYAFSFDEKRLSKKQFINLAHFQEKEGNSIELSYGELKGRLLHDLSRFLLKINKVANADVQLSPPPIKLFVSHAKVDGELLAMQFRDYILQHKKLKTFFDANDIADADDFEQALKASLKNSAIVAFLTDRYSSREWCRIEIIVAKRNHSPLVVVNCLKKGEKRSFPYIGNVPVTCLTDDNFEEIINLSLYQTLNNLFVEEKLRKEAALYGLDKMYRTLLLENAPELFNFIDIKKIQQNSTDKREVLVVYPDPPIGTEELSLLNELDDKISFISPSSFYQIINNGKQ